MNDDESNDILDNEPSNSSFFQAEPTQAQDAYERNVMSSVPWGALGVATEGIDETVMNFQRKK